MSEPSTPASERRRLWLTIGEVVGVLALVVAGLNYWDSHRDRVSAEKAASHEAQARRALVMTGEADPAGARVMLQPVNPAQVIQSQRYLFPHAVLAHAMEVSAARPQIDLDWIAPGLRGALDHGHAPADGEATLPVGVITTYIEDGETYTDTSIYRVGFAYRSHFLTGRKITLQGISLGHRGAGGDLQAEVDARWARTTPAPAAS